MILAPYWQAVVSPASQNKFSSQTSALGDRPVYLSIHVQAGG